MKDEGIFHQGLPALAAEPFHFPDSDRFFLPANPLQAKAIISFLNSMESHFLDVPNVVVDGSVFMYYDPRDPAKRISPDIFVVLDHDMGGRESYKFWVERKSPDFALDVISPESEIRGQADQTELYAELGIKEYFRFQPDPAREAPRLVGYRLWGREYLELSHHPSVGPDGALGSETLGVSLRPEGARLRLRNLATGEDCLWFSEKDAQIAAMEQQLALAEARVRRLKQERRAAEQRAAAATERARVAAQERRTAEQRAAAFTERARRAAQERRAAEQRAAAFTERARRAAQERRAAEQRAAATKKRAESLEGREAHLKALLAAVGS